MILGVVLTGSRTGLAALLLIAAWSAFDRRMDGRLRIGLVAAPVVHGLALWAGTAWNVAHGVDVSNPIARGAAGFTAYRGQIWSGAVALIRAQLWLGVGWG